jgi:hypothetical protein
MLECLRLAGVVVSPPEEISPSFEKIPPTPRGRLEGTRNAPSAALTVVPTALDVHTKKFHDARHDSNAAATSRFELTSRRAGRTWRQQS